jgi:hypothetical protein
VESSKTQSEQVLSQAVVKMQNVERAVVRRMLKGIFSLPGTVVLTGKASRVKRNVGRGGEE